MAQSVSEKLPAEANDRTWGVLIARSPAALNRKDGNIRLTSQEHVLGRLVRDSHFFFESANISGFHCRIFRKSLGDEGFGVFVKDSSSNGTYINGLKLKKEGPEHRIHHGDIISLASPAELATETGFAYVFHDTSAGYLKRKQEDETVKPDDNKRMRAAADGPVSLTDVRRLERSNQELRQKLESECVKNENLVAELKAAKASTDNIVKEAVDQCEAEYLEKMEKLQAELANKASACEEYSGKCEQMESTIDDLNKRLRSAQQSRLEAEEALKTIKGNREELEKQIERERNQWKQERDEAEVQHTKTMEKLRAEATDELKRQADVYSRQIKQLEDELAAQQELKEACRAQIDNLTKTLEDERQTRMDSDKKAQELQILLNNEQRTCSTLTEDMKNLKGELEKAYENQQLYKMESEEARDKLFAIQEEKDGIMNKLKLEKQRLEGARDRILLRETQLRAFQTTAEAISVLQQKQQEQLKAMMKTLADDDAEYANAMENRDEEKDDVVFKDPGMTQLNGVEDMDMEANTFVEKNYEQIELQEMAQQLETTQVAATQIDATLVLATQAIPENVAAETQAIAENAAALATQLIPGAVETESAPKEEEGGAPDAQLQLPKPELQHRMPSMCTADLRASESMGTWVNETPPAENSIDSDHEMFDAPQQQQEAPPEAGVFQPGSIVGNSDSLMPAGNDGENPGFNNTLSSQTSPSRPDLNEVALDSGSDTQED